MDGIKLEKWKQRFHQELASIRIEYNAFFLEKSLDDMFSLNVADTSNELSLQFDKELPNEIKDRLSNTLLRTKPEDSV